jgi:hypothetical protein
LVPFFSAAAADAPNELFAFELDGPSGRNKQGGFLMLGVVVPRLEMVGVMGASCGVATKEETVGFILRRRRASKTLTELFQG